jgi:hypothetical protein
LNKQLTTGANKINDKQKCPVDEWIDAVSGASRYPGAAAILNTICSHYDVPLSVAADWVLRAREEAES